MEQTNIFIQTKQCLESCTIGLVFLMLELEYNAMVGITSRQSLCAFMFQDFSQHPFPLKHDSEYIPSNQQYLLIWTTCEWCVIFTCTATMPICLMLEICGHRPGVDARKPGYSKPRAAVNQVGPNNFWTDVGLQIGEPLGGWKKGFAYLSLFSSQKGVWVANTTKLFQGTVRVVYPTIR